MRKISITFNFHEYKNLKAFSDIPYFSGDQYLVNIEMKDIIWNAFNYVLYRSRKSNMDLHAFLNLFFEKYDLPLLQDGLEEKIQYPGVFNKKNQNLTILPGLNRLYILRLTDVDVAKLNELLKIVSGFSPALNKISYSEILRTCLHFIIDYKSHKIAFSSFIYISSVLHLSPYLPLSDNMIEQIHDRITLDEIALHYSTISTFENRTTGKNFQEVAKEIYEAKNARTSGKQLTYEDTKMNIAFFAYCGYIAMRTQIIDFRDNIPTLVLKCYTFDRLPETVLKELLNDFISYYVAYIDLFYYRTK